MGDICVQVPCAIEVCIGQRCPAVPRAVCRPDDCNTCKPAWYLDNQPVDCVTGEIDQRPIVNRKLQVAPWQRTCAPGEPLTPCDHRVCEKKLCRNFPDAVCRPDGCGGCADTWFLDNKLVDCLSDACPPGVPIVKCVDDPCKYFSHYCPSAECRASECGSCEAKFFSNGQEIDCAMPPKTCPAGVEARSCPWYTCPADICPTNRRLMCRIDPCDAFCKYDFIDIYTGEPMPCRVFDGDGSQKRQREEQQRAQAEVRQVADISVGAQPSLRGLVDTKVAEISVKPDILTGGMQPVGRMVVDNGIKAEPILQNAGPPITDPDILSLLRSFPHEMMIVPTASIQSALQNGKDIIATAEAAIKSQVKSENKLLGVPQQLPTFAKQPVEAPKPVIVDVVKEKAVSKPVVVDVVKEKAVASVVPHVIPPIPPKEQVITAGKTQIIVAGPSDGIYPELGTNQAPDASWTIIIPNVIDAS
ncbi:uncharacterized protein LOC127865563 [Dreissena polymorpha]|uniref:Uncharacterized protein n=1 Tax=Dreissena polymorpha TaxID=45954 RepID=A0A9D4LJT3_DREPO|nr:uncharacterized protein LOC127865563 [Dreissena polymorpha]KAH3860045.1 hypothetical protein DPMN_022938 [Dreissena polymorpha]